jgi:hypothetical protein
MSELEESIKVEALYEFALVGRPIELTIRITPIGQEALYIGHLSIHLNNLEDAPLVQKHDGELDEYFENPDGWTIQKSSESISIYSNEVTIAPNDSFEITLKNLRVSEIPGIAEIAVHFVNQNVRKILEIEKFIEVPAAVDVSRNSTTYYKPGDPDFVFTWVGTNILYCDLIVGDTYYPQQTHSGQLAPMKILDTTTFTVLGYTGDGIGAPVVAHYTVSTGARFMDIEAEGWHAQNNGSYLGAYGPVKLKWKANTTTKRVELHSDPPLEIGTPISLDYPAVKELMLPAFSSNVNMRMVAFDGAGNHQQEDDELFTFKPTTGPIVLDFGFYSDLERRLATMLTIYWEVENATKVSFLGASALAGRDFPPVGSVSFYPDFEVKSALDDAEPLKLPSTFPEGAQTPYYHGTFVQFAQQAMLDLEYNLSLTLRAEGGSHTIESTPLVKPLKPIACGVANMGVPDKAPYCKLFVQLGVTQGVYVMLKVDGKEHGPFNFLANMEFWSDIQRVEIATDIFLAAQMVGIEGGLVSYTIYLFGLHANSFGASLEMQFLLWRGEDVDPLLVQSFVIK